MPINRKHKKCAFRETSNYFKHITENHACMPRDRSLHRHILRSAYRKGVNRLDMFFLVQRFCNVALAYPRYSPIFFNTRGDAQSNLPWIPSDHTGTDNLLPFVYIVCLYIRRKEIQPCFFQFFNFIDLSFKIVKKPFMTTSDTH